MDNLEDDALGEVAAAVLSIKGPYLDLSDGGKIYEQTRPLHDYRAEPEENFPMAIIYVDGEACNLAANDRFEISLYFDISLVYKFTPGEGRIKALERGRRCLRQIYRRIFTRQRSGSAPPRFYMDGAMEANAANSDNIDGNNFIAVATAKFTLKQMEPNMEAEYA